jgi:hypothetical protein
MLIRSPKEGCAQWGTVRTRVITCIGWTGELPLNQGPTLLTNPTCCLGCGFLFAPHALGKPRSLSSLCQPYGCFLRTRVAYDTLLTRCSHPGRAGSGTRRSRASQDFLAAGDELAKAHDGERWARLPPWSRRTVKRRRRRVPGSRVLIGFASRSVWKKRRGSALDFFRTPASGVRWTFFRASSGLNSIQTVCKQYGTSIAILLPYWFHSVPKLFGEDGAAKDFTEQH